VPQKYFSREDSRNCISFR